MQLLVNCSEIVKMLSIGIDLYLQLLNQILIQLVLCNRALIELRSIDLNKLLISIDFDLELVELFEYFGKKLQLQQLSIIYEIFYLKKDIIIYLFISASGQFQITDVFLSVKRYRQMPRHLSVKRKRLFVCLVYLYKKDFV